MDVPFSTAQLESRREAARLIVEEREKLLRFGAGRLGGAEAASRFLRDVLARRLGEPDKFRRGESLPRWLDRKLTRALLDWGEQYPDAAGDALRKSLQAWSDATRQCLREVLDAIEPRYRDVLRRVDFGSESKGSVARDLGLSGPTIDVLLHRARHAARRRMEKIFAFSDPHERDGCD